MSVQQSSASEVSLKGKKGLKFGYKGTDLGYGYVLVEVSDGRGRFRNASTFKRCAWSQINLIGFSCSDENVSYNVLQIC